MYFSRLLGIHYTKNVHCIMFTMCGESYKAANGDNIVVGGNIGKKYIDVGLLLQAIGNILH